MQDTVDESIGFEFQHFFTHTFGLQVRITQHFVNRGIEEVTQVFADGLNLGVALSLPSGLPLEPFATCEEAPTNNLCLLQYGFKRSKGQIELPNLPIRICDIHSYTREF